MATSIVSHKVCSACKLILPIVNFHRNAAMKDGLNGVCKPCKEIRRRSRRAFKPTAESKQCVICEQIKPAAEFPVSRRELDGLSFQCKECTSNHSKQCKRCARCRVVKPIDAFGRYRTTKDGYNHYCKSCSVELSLINYRRYHERAKLYARNYIKRPGCREKGRERQRRYSQTERGRVSMIKGHLKACYGMSLEEFNDIMINQKGLCAICRQPQVHGKRRRLYVDHDHKTGAIRGLLCCNCNSGIGRFSDDPHLLNRAIKYLRSFRSTESSKPLPRNFLFDRSAK